LITSKKNFNKRATTVSVRLVIATKIWLTLSIGNEI